MSEVVRYRRANLEANSMRSAARCMSSLGRGVVGGEGVVVVVLTAGSIVTVTALTLALTPSMMVLSVPAADESAQENPTFATPLARMNAHTMAL